MIIPSNVKDIHTFSESLNFNDSNWSLIVSQVEPLIRRSGCAHFPDDIKTPSDPVRNERNVHIR